MEDHEGDLEDQEGEMKDMSMKEKLVLKMKKKLKMDNIKEIQMIQKEISKIKWTKNINKIFRIIYY